MQRSSILACVLFFSSCQCEDDVSPWAFDEAADVGFAADAGWDAAPDAAEVTDEGGDASDRSDASTPLDLGMPNAEFAGLWKVDQPAHAGYEATVYDFTATGELVEVESLQLGAGLVPTGRVARCLEYALEDEGGWCTSWGVECVFGDAWRSVADAPAVEVATDCSDGAQRWVRLDFPGGFDGDYLVPEVSVDGDDTWAHNSFDWAWARCADDPCIVGF